jgi:16S rRNA (uracil1498-N3)-methyltransferase
LSLIEKRENQKNPKIETTVYMAVVKHDNLALAVEKLNEIGVSDLVLFYSSNCQLAIPVKLEKLQSIANQSCKQCGRSIPLKVRGTILFGELLFKEIIGKKISALFADESLRGAPTTKQPKHEPHAIIIGPEGGFTESERDNLAKIATPISLGKRILRAETAALVGATLLLSKLGEI